MLDLGMHTQRGDIDLDLLMADAHLRSSVYDAEPKDVEAPP